MSKRFQFHSVRTKLIALGGIFAAIIVAFTLVAANTFSSMTDNSAASSRASHAEALVDEAYQHWASDDGQSNMYVAVLALGDPSQLQLAETTWGQAAQAYKDSNKSVDAAAKIVSDADERAPSLPPATASPSTTSSASRSAPPDRPAKSPVR
jgi:hypothetical protein